MKEAARCLGTGDGCSPSFLDRVCRKDVDGSPAKRYIWGSMTRARRRPATESTTEDGYVYVCVRVADEWHLTQEQASPPPIHVGGSHTMCGGPWGDFKLGYERRRPTCKRCVQIVDEDEAKRGWP